MSSYLNQTTVLRRISSRLGMSHHLLELNEFDIMEVVMQETLPEYSRHFPYIAIAELSRDDKVPNRDGFYYLEVEGLEIMGVSRLVSSNQANTATRVSTNYYTDPIARQLFSNATGAYQHPTLFTYHHPDMVEVHPKDFWWEKIAIKLQCVHPPNMATIPIKHREFFLNLAFYDVCLAIQPIRFQFQNINTSFGSIELFNDNIESAFDKREELIERMKKDSLKSARRRKVFIG